MPITMTKAGAATAKASAAAPVGATGRRSKRGQSREQGLLVAKQGRGLGREGSHETGLEAHAQDLKVRRVEVGEDGGEVAGWQVQVELERGDGVDQVEDLVLEGAHQAAAAGRDCGA